MSELSFQGASDDLVEIWGDKIAGADEYNVDPDSKDMGYAGTWNVGAKLRVHAFYGPGGVWFFGVSQIAENVPLPDWTIRIVTGDLNGYSTKLIIDVPDGVGVFKEDTSYRRSS